MLNIKNMISSRERGEKPPKPIKRNQTSNPWLIEQVKNGLKAVNVKILTDLLRPDKKLQAQYFENDRIYGTNAYSSDGILSVMTMFDELQTITPKTVGYIFNRRQYLYHNDGILRKDISTKEEEFFSDKTLRNENIDNFFQLTEPEIEPVEPEIVEDETDNDRETVYRQSTELETT